MAIGTDSNGISGPYLANGVTTAFPFTFQVLTTAQVKVILIDEDGVETVATGYTTSLTTTAPSVGAVTFSTAPADGLEVYVLLDLPFTQETQFVDGSAWQAGPVNKANDRAVLRDQVLRREVGRALKVPIGEAAPQMGSLADAEGKVLGMLDGVIVPVPGDLVGVEAARLDAESAAIEAREARDDVVSLIGYKAGLATMAELQALVASEVAAASAGAYWIPEKAYLFQDDAGTVPVTATGQTVAVIKSANGVADYDLIQTDAAKRGAYFESYGMGFVRCDNGKGYYSRATVSLKVPSFIAVAAKYAGFVGRYIFGLNKNTNTRHILVSNSLSRLDASAYGDAADLNRPWVQTFSANYSCPSGPVMVMHSLLASTNKLDAVFETSAVRDSNIEKTTAWVNADTVTGMRLVLNGTSTTSVNADASCDFYGGVAMSAEPASRIGIAKWLQLRSRPQITANDEVILIVGDSTGDDVGTDLGDYGPEFGYRLAETHLVASRPTNCVILQGWNREGNCFRGMQRFSNGNLLKRTFVINASSAGSGPGYFFGERFATTIGLLPKVDYVIWNHGHNLASGDATIQADANRKYLRAGQYLDAMDQVRQNFPTARHLAIKTYPIGTPGNNNIDVPVKAVDHIAAKYADMDLIDLYTIWDAAGRPAGWYCADKVHPSIPDGVTEMLDPFVAVFNALSPLATNTPALIDGRKILPSENLLLNGGFEGWTAGVPDYWSAYGSATISKVGTRAKVVASAGGIKQTISATALQSKIVTVVVAQEIVQGGDLYSGWVKFKTDTGTIGDGRWQDGPYQTWDKERLFYFHFPVPASATTLTIEISAGQTGSGTIYLSRAVLVAGDDPRDILT